MSLRDRLQSGQRVYGTLIVSTSPQWVPAVAGAGLDFVFIDTEHIPIGRQTLGWMCRAYGAAGLPPIVRIPSPDPFEACKALDGGAAGIIAPYIESADEVRDLAAAVKRRPIKGKRAACPETFEPALRGYIDQRCRDTLLLVNIESVPAIEGLGAILAVPELDGVIVGPHDLSCSLGIPEDYRNGRFDEAVTGILRRARAAGKAAGIHFWEGIDLEARWAAPGLGNIVIHSGDISLFAQALRRDLTDLRQSLGDAPRPRDASAVNI